MRFSLFRSGPVPRLVVAALYAVFAFGAVALVERASARRAVSSPATQTTPASSPDVAATLRIEIESVNAIASWTVRLDAIALTPAESSPNSWSATTTASALAARLVVDAAHAAGAPATNALRLRVARGTARIDRTFWCGGDCMLDVPLAELAPIAAPAR